MNTEKNSNTDELNLEQKVTIKNIAPWTTGFRRIESSGDVTIPPSGTVRLARSEIISQVQNGNSLFTGTDHRGTHATLYIDDKPTRLELDFDSDDEENKYSQCILNDAVVIKLFSYKSIKIFEDNLKKSVVTMAEKSALIEIIKKLKFNDFEKIRVIENYTGLKL